MRQGWEQARFLAAAVLQPYSRKTLKPEDVAKFPWEEKSKSTDPVRPSSLERMREVEARVKKTNAGNSRPDTCAPSSEGTR